eukprot:TRINITY_DN50232_c1_g1_i1.p2 TRINITY_DN50232_c1_g1~~TRINITY_DN50232_c1_g1_i1.p2  ORF type:complete len:165 (+),score=80.49 TRINITY_DN50232_c1_g1_i1:59-496(+)
MPNAQFKEALQEGFVKKDKSRVTAAALSGKTIGLYVSAHWCPPCRQFTPVLAQFYEEYKKLDPNFEIIFVSSDKTEAEFWSYFGESHGDYLAADFNGKARQLLKGVVNAPGIPTFAIYTQDGDLISMGGRAKVMQGAAAVHSGGW